MALPASDTVLTQSEVSLPATYDCYATLPLAVETDLTVAVAEASLAVTGGVHTALDVAKATMVGAHATHLGSALVANGPRHLRTVRAELESRMAENEWSSLDEMRGNMSFGRVPDPAAYERANFRSMFQ